MKILKPLNSLTVKIISTLILACLSFQSVSGMDDIDEVIETITISIETNDTMSFLKLFDMYTYSDRILSNTTYDSGTKAAYKKVFQSKKRVLVNNLFLNTFANGESDVVFKRSFIKDKKKTLQFRLIGPDQAVVFLDIILDKDKKGDFKIIDFFPIESGEYLSETAGQAIMLAVPKQNYLEKILNISTIDNTVLDLFTKMTKAYSTANYQQAFSAYQKLPIELRTYPAFARMGTQIAINLNDDTYFEQLSFINEHFSDDPSFSFSLVDYLYFIEDYSGAINSLMVLNKDIKGDAYILYLVAGTYGLIGDYENQFKFITQSLELEPELFYAQQGMLDYYIVSGSFEKAVEYLIELNDIYDGYFVAEDFYGEPTYEEFIASDDFKSYFEI